MLLLLLLLVIIFKKQQQQQQKRESQTHIYSYLKYNKANKIWRNIELKKIKNNRMSVCGSASALNRIGCRLVSFFDLLFKLYQWNLEI